MSRSVEKNRDLESVKVMGRLAESTDCSIRIVQRLISGKEKKGKGRDGWRRWSAKRPAARLPKNIKKLDGPGWVKAYIR